MAEDTAFKTSSPQPAADVAAFNEYETPAETFTSTTKNEDDDILINSTSIESAESEFGLPENNEGLSNINESIGILGEFGLHSTNTIPPSDPAFVQSDQPENVQLVTQIDENDIDNNSLSDSNVVNESDELEINTTPADNPEKFSPTLEYEENNATFNNDVTETNYFPTTSDETSQFTENSPSELVNQLMDLLHDPSDVVVRNFGLENLSQPSELVDSTPYGEETTIDRAEMNSSANNDDITEFSEIMSDDIDLLNSDDLSMSEDYSSLLS